jgi:hypothetical protein
MERINYERNRIIFPRMNDKIIGCQAINRFRVCRQIKQRIERWSEHGKRRRTNVFKIPSGERTPYLNLEEGVFNEVSFFVDIFVIMALKFSVDLGRDQRNDAAREKGKDDIVGIVGFIGENISGV